MLNEKFAETFNIQHSILHTQHCSCLSPCKSSRAKHHPPDPPSRVETSFSGYCLSASGVMLWRGSATAMNGKKARSAAAFLTGLILCVPAFAQGPDAAWRTISTPHFRIHFPAEDEAWAGRVAGDIESVRAAVVREVGFAHDG